MFTATGTMAWTDWISCIGNVPHPIGTEEGGVD